MKGEFISLFSSHLMCRFSWCSCHLVAYQLHVETVGPQNCGSASPDILTPGVRLASPPRLGLCKPFMGRISYITPRLLPPHLQKNGMILVDIIVFDYWHPSPKMGPWGYMLGGPSRPKYCFSRCLKKRGNLWILIHFGLSNLQTIPLLNVFCLVLYIANGVILWPTSVGETKNLWNFFFASTELKTLTSLGKRACS